MQTHFLAASLAASVAVFFAAPAFAQGTRVAEPSGGFSYTAPAGWHIKTFPGLKYKICYAAPSGGFAPNLTVLDETAAVPLDKYVQLSLRGMQRVYTGLAVVSQKPFATASGLRGVRMAVNGTTQGRKMHQVFYVFPAGSRKFIATASNLAADGTKYEAATDAAMKTFKLQ